MMAAMAATPDSENIRHSVAADDASRADQSNTDDVIRSNKPTEQEKR